jgi:MFS family permease
VPRICGTRASELLSRYLHKLESLSKRQRRIFLIVSVATFFNNYDGAVLNLALVQIQNGLHIVEAALGPTVALITLGNVVAPLITSQADRRGRRRLLLYALAAFSVTSGLTAFSWNLTSFIAFKFLTVTFSAAEGSIALVILIEEASSTARGLVVGLLGLISASGYGAAALAFAWIPVFPFGWRGLFMVAFLPLLLILPLWRLLPESRLFEASSKAIGGQSFFGPFRALVRSYPDRLMKIAAVMFLNAMSGTPAGLMQSKYLQQVHGWSPATVSILLFTGGSIGVMGSVAGGYLGDRYGRRRSGPLFIALAPVFGVLFFYSSGGLMVTAWIIGLFAQTAASAILNTFAAELFPTSHRSTANSTIGVAATLGGSTSLMLESWLYQLTGSHWRAISLLMSAAILAALVVAFFFPETAGEELDAISPERSLLRKSRRRPPRS